MSDANTPAPTTLASEEPSPYVTSFEYSSEGEVVGYDAPTLEEREELDRLGSSNS